MRKGIAPLGCFLIVVASWAAFAPPASAHIRMDFPVGRYSDDFQKEPPCGKGAVDGRSANINTFEPGATVVVRFTETIDHTGFYRVAFDPDGSDLADFDDPAHELARLDDPSEPSGREKTIEVVLPDIECDNCTLQLIQDMGRSGLYYQCADLVLRRGGGNDLDDGSRPRGGCGQAAPASQGAALLLLFLLGARSVRAR
jgi:hypothetical protein